MDRSPDRKVPARRGAAVVAVLALIFGAMTAGLGHAEESFPTEPILRIDLKTHSNMIRRMATDAQNRYLVTASDDKTARVWSLPEGQLLKVLRVPIAEGSVGQLHAVAMSPDGNTIALGGDTNKGAPTSFISSTAPPRGCSECSPACRMSCTT